MISRRDDESVVLTTLRRSNEEISHFLASLRAGEFRQAPCLSKSEAIGNKQQSFRASAPFDHSSRNYKEFTRL